MNVEKTIEFILEMQAKTEARFGKTEEQFARAEERFARVEARADRADHRMDRLEAVVKGLVRSGVSLRSDVSELQKWRVQTEKFHARTEENLAEIAGKLDTLIDIVDKSFRRNGGEKA